MDTRNMSNHKNSRADRWNSSIRTIHVKRTSTSSNLSALILLLHDSMHGIRLCSARHLKGMENRLYSMNSELAKN